MCASGEAIELAFGERRIERHVPGVARNLLNFLAFVADADQIGFAPDFAAAQICQAGVVETATHAQPESVLVKPHQRHEQQVQLAGAYRSGRPVFVDAEAVEIPAGAAGEAGEVEMLLEATRHDGQIAGFAQAQGHG